MSGYVTLNWPEGVVRDEDRGMSGLSAEDMEMLHHALFQDESQLQFVRRGKGKFLGV